MAIDLTPCRHIQADKLWQAWHVLSRGMCTVLHMSAACALPVALDTGAQHWRRFGCSCAAATGLGAPFDIALEMQARHIACEQDHAAARQRQPQD